MTTEEKCPVLFVRLAGCPVTLDRIDRATLSLSRDRGGQWLRGTRCAMGIGRFAFTPILPMMQADDGISVTQGGWLASDNYVGYLAGSLFAIHPNIPARTAIRIGLVLIAACTLAMDIEQHFAAWLILRAIPGFASASVLVVVSTWTLPRLAQAGRGHPSGTVYACVGTGIMFAGVVCLVLVRAGASSDTAWMLLGVSAVGVTIAVWSVLRCVPAASSW